MGNSLALSACFINGMFVKSESAILTSVFCWEVEEQVEEVEEAEDDEEEEDGDGNDDIEEADEVDERISLSLPLYLVFVQFVFGIL